MPKESYTPFLLDCEASPDFPRPPVALSPEIRNCIRFVIFPFLLSWHAVIQVVFLMVCNRDMAKQQVVLEQLQWKHRSSLLECISQDDVGQSVLASAVQDEGIFRCC